MKLIKADYIMAVAIILMLGTHTITHYLIAKHTSIEDTQRSAKEITTLVEQNPIAAMILQFEKAKYVFSFVLFPAMVCGVYYYHRRKHKDTNQEYLESMAVIIFLSFLFNFFNDASYLMGFLAQ